MCLFTPSRLTPDRPRVILGLRGRRHRLLDLLAYREVEERTWLVASTLMKLMSMTKGDMWHTHSSHLT